MNNQGIIESSYFRFKDRNLAKKIIDHLFNGFKEDLIYVRDNIRNFLNSSGINLKFNNININNLYIHICNSKAKHESVRSAHDIILRLFRCPILSGLFFNNLDYDITDLDDISEFSDICLSEWNNRRINYINNTLIYTPLDDLVKRYIEYEKQYN